MKDLKMNLKLFGDETPEHTPANQGTQTSAVQEIDYDKLAQIVQGKQSATEDSVLRGYFKNQGLSREDADRAIADFKNKQKANDPNNKVAELQEKVTKYESEKVLSKKNVKQEDYDYVSFKVAQAMKEKSLTFEKALDGFLKDNPRFTETASAGYRVVNTGTPSGGAGTSENTNDSINAAIRRAAGKEF